MTVGDAIPTAVLNSIDAAVIAVDADDRVISYANPAVQTVFGYRPDEIVGKSTEQLHVDNEHFRKFATEGDPFLESHGAFRMEYPMKRKDGTVFPAEITVTELDPSFGWKAGVVSLVRDVSDRKAAEDKLAAREEQLRQAQRLDAIGRLAGGVANDSTTF